MTYKFKVGDRVKEFQAYNKIGTIIGIDKDSDYAPYAVQFDDAINGHDCFPFCGKDNHCRWLDEEDLELIQRCNDLDTINEEEANDLWDVKDCPCCGGKAHIHCSKMKEENYSLNVAFIRCESCWLQTSFNTDLEMLVRAWNKRV